MGREEKEEVNGEVEEFKEEEAEEEVWVRALMSPWGDLEDN